MDTMNDFWLSLGNVSFTFIFLAISHPIITQPRAFHNFLGKAMIDNEKLRVVGKVCSVMDWAISQLLMHLKTLLMSMYLSDSQRN